MKLESASFSSSDTGFIMKFFKIFIRITFQHLCWLHFSGTSVLIPTTPFRPMDGKGKKTTIVAAVAVVIVAILLATCFGPWASDDSDDSLEGEVYIVHTNDTHGHYADTLGFSKVAALRDDLESRGATVFLMDAGDAFQGSAETLLSQGASSVDILNAVGYDVMTPGNHEFDYTLDTYLEYTAELEFPTICANLDWADTGESVFPGYTVLERDGVSLGVFGITTPDTADLISPGLLDDVVFTDPAEAASEMVATLSALDVDWIVALGHIGVDRSSDYTSDGICAEVEGIDVFIDGHSHTTMSDGKVVDGSIDLVESDTLIASTGDVLNAIGLVHLDPEDGPTAELITSYGGKSESVTDVVDSVMAEYDAMLSEVVGHTDVTLTGERTESRLGEVGLGDFVCDTILEVSGADIAVYNGARIRAEIGAGDITVRDVVTSFPYANYMVTKVLTGEEVVHLLEVGLQNLPAASGSFLQVGGMDVVYDSSAPPMERLVSVTLPDGSALDMDGEYTVVSNEYVMNGGALFGFLTEIPETGTFGLVSEALYDRFTEVGTVTVNTDGRLVDIGDSDSAGTETESV